MKILINLFIFAFLIVGKSLAQTDVGIALEFAPSKANFFDGEPIIVVFKLFNQSTNIINVNLGYDRFGKLLFQLKQSVEYTNCVNQGGLSYPPVVSLAPGGTYKRTICLDQWLLPFKIGTNTVVGKLNIEGKDLAGNLEVNIIESTDNQLAFALGVLACQAATTINTDEHNTINDALHWTVKHSLKARKLLAKQMDFIKRVIENADTETTD
jgi:hypothetical protein